MSPNPKMIFYILFGTINWQVSKLIRKFTPIVQRPDTKISPFLLTLTPFCFASFFDSQTNLRQKDRAVSAA